MVPYTSNDIVNDCFIMANSLLLLFFIQFVEMVFKFSNEMLHIISRKNVSNYDSTMQNEDADNETNMT